MSRPVLRTAPVQARSQMTLQRILDATAAVVDDVGIDAVRTQIVADRADVAIGTVYRFFCDRPALIRALSERNLERYVTKVSEFLAADESLDHWWDAISGTIDIFVEMHRTEPSFRLLRFGDVIDVTLIDSEHASNDLLAGAFRELMIHRFDVKDTPDLQLHLEVVTTISDALLKRAFLYDPDGQAEMIAECKALVREYLGSRLVQS
jgi:AcrR family transcriptional regulator